MRCGMGVCKSDLCQPKDHLHLQATFPWLKSPQRSIHSRRWIALLEKAQGPNPGLFRFLGYRRSHLHHDPMPLEDLSTALSAIASKSQKTKKP